MSISVWYPLHYSCQGTDFRTSLYCHNACWECPMMVIPLSFICSATAVRIGTGLLIRFQCGGICCVFWFPGSGLRLAQSQEENGNYLKICLRLSLSEELCKTTNDQCSGWYHAPRRDNWRLVGGRISCHACSNACSRRRRGKRPAWLWLDD